MTTRLSIGDTLAETHSGHEVRVWTIRDVIRVSDPPYRSHDGVNCALAVLESGDGFAVADVFDHEHDPTRRTTSVCLSDAYPTRDAAFWAFMGKRLKSAQLATERATHRLTVLREACAAWLDLVADASTPDPNRESSTRPASIPMSLRNIEMDP